MSGFTREMVFSVPSSLVESQASEMKLQPVSGTAPYTTPGVAIQFAQEILPNTFADFSNTLVLNGRVTFAGTLNNTNTAVLLGYLGSLFSLIRVRVNGQTVDEIQNWSQLAAKIYDVTCTQSDKRALATTMGFDPINPSAQGAIIGTTNTVGAGLLHNGLVSSTTFSFSLPIPCTLTNCSTMWPLFCSRVEWDFVIANPSDYTATLLGTPVIGVSISQTQLVFQTLRLADAPFRALMAMQPIDQEGNLLIKSDTWQYTSGQLAASSPAGQVNIVYSGQYKSITRVLMTASTADSAERTYSGINPNCSSVQMVIGNRLYPALPIVTDNPAEVMYNNMKALGSVYSAAHTGCIDPLAFARSSTTGGGTPMALHGAYNSTQATLAVAINSAAVITTPAALNTGLMSNKWFLLIDLESISNNKQSLFGGASSRGSGSSFLRLNIAQTLAASAHTVHIWSNYQLVIKVNVNTFQCVVDF